jgi:type II secretion system protein N
MKKALAACLIVAALIWGAWLVALPQEVLLARVEGALAQGQVRADITGFRKGLFYNFHADAVDISASGVRVLRVQDLRGRLLFLPLLRLTAALDLRGRAGGGPLSGRVELGRSGYGVRMDAAGARLEELGLVQSNRLPWKGEVRADLAVTNGRGSVTFSVRKTRLGPLSLYGMSIPLESVRDIRGAVRIRGATLVVESISLEGPDIYARVSGNIRGSRADLTLEVMPVGDRFSDPLLGQLLARYKVAPGHYVIPVKQSLRF